MLKQSAKLFRLLLAAAATVAIGIPASAQNQTQPAGQSSATSKKGGASITCDGALDIVPTKAMSFVRKRRPNKPNGSDSKPQAAPADSKPQAKPSGRPNSGE